VATFAPNAGMAACERLIQVGDLSNGGCAGRWLPRRSEVRRGGPFVHAPI